MSQQGVPRNAGRVRILGERIALTPWPRRADWHPELGTHVSGMPSFGATSLLLNQEFLVSNVNVD